MGAMGRWTGNRHGRSHAERDRWLTHEHHHVLMGSHAFGGQHNGGSETQSPELTQQRGEQAHSAQVWGPHVPSGGEGLTQEPESKNVQERNEEPREGWPSCNQENCNREGAGQHADGGATGTTGTMRSCLDFMLSKMRNH